MGLILRRCVHRSMPSILDNKAYVVVYGIVLFLLVQYLVPMIMLTVLNSYVIMSLRRSTAYRTGVLLSYRARAPRFGSSIRSTNSATPLAVATPLAGDPARRDDANQASDGVRVDVRVGATSDHHRHRGRHHVHRLLHGCHGRSGHLVAAAFGQLSRLAG